MFSFKPLKAARVEAARAMSTYTFAAVEARKLAGDMVPMDAAQAGEGKLALKDNEAFLDGVGSTPALDETMKLLEPIALALYVPRLFFVTGGYHRYFLGRKLWDKAESLPRFMFSTGTLRATSLPKTGMNPYT